MIFENIVVAVLFSAQEPDFLVETIYRHRVEFLLFDVFGVIMFLVESFKFFPEQEAEHSVWSYFHVQRAYSAVKRFDAVGSVDFLHTIEVAFVVFTFWFGTKCCKIKKLSLVKYGSLHRIINWTQIR